MQKSKFSNTILAVLILMLAILTITGCKDKTPAPENVNPPQNEQPAQTAPDPRMIIQGFQQALEPAGLPLTEEQQKRIMEVYNPAAPDDMRPVYGVFTKEQKNVFVSTLRAQLAETKFPLTKAQEDGITAMGPGSKEKSWLELLSKEQMQILMGGIGQGQ